MSVVRTGTFWEKVMGAKSFEMLVGAPGFEPGTSCAQGKLTDHILLILPVFSASQVTT